jgi:type IV pilus assembly protein PilE
LATRAFALVEILIVVLLIAILASLALPAYFNSLERTRSAEAVGFLKVIAASQVKYAAEQDSLSAGYSSSLADLDTATTLAGGSALTKYFSLNLDASATPGVPVNERVAYLRRNSVERPAARGQYILSVCEDGRVYCTDGFIGDCQAVNQRQGSCLE